MGDIDGTGNSLANRIFGNSGSNVLKGEGGNDLLQGRGGADSISGDAGNDVVILDSNEFLKVDGGSGADTAQLSELGALIDLTGASGARFQSVEILDLTSTESNTLRIDSSGVAQIAGAGGAFDANTLLIKSDEADAVDLADSGWTKGAEVTDPFGQSGTYTRYTNDTSTVLIGGNLAVFQIGDIDLSELTADQGIKVSGAAGGGPVSGIGDINDDGFDDFIVGAPGADPAGRTNAGQSYVIFGKAGGLPDIDVSSLAATDGFKISGAAAGDASGSAVSDAGDINGDGIADLLVSAPDADPFGRTSAGQSYVIYGKSGGPGDIDLAALAATQGFAVAGTADFSHSGRSVRSAGDVNGDGIDDVIIGAPSSVFEGGPYSESYVIYGKVGGLGNIDLTTLTAAEGFKITSTYFSDYMGRSVSGIGDVNGDGFDDVAVGAAFGVPGRGYVIFGRDDAPSAIGIATLGPTDGFKIFSSDDFTESSGMVVTSAGDINGDGFEDLAVAVGEDGPYAGRTTVIYGKAGGPGEIDRNKLSSDQGFHIYGVAPYDISGWSISSAGDVNGDGLDDLLIGAPEADPGGRTSAGEAYLIFGKLGGLDNIELATLTPDVGLKISGAAEDDETGRSVRAAGDINGDGFSDIIIAAPGGETQAYVLYGGDLTNSVTHIGTPGDDELIGSEADERFIGGLGNDTLVGGGGADAFHGGAGDDTIVLAPGDLIRADGGNGIDTVSVGDFGPSLDLTGDLRHRFQSIEILDTDQLMVNQITIDASTIAHMTGHNDGAFGPNTLLIKSDEGDVVALADQGWAKGGEVTDPFGQDGTYVSWTNGAVTALIANKSEVFQLGRIDLADLQPDEGIAIAGASNVGLAGDINADGIDDFIVSADKSYVIFGQAGGLSGIDLDTLSPDQGFIVERNVAGDDAGVGGGSTGDFNGDGIADVIFGAPGADTAAGTDTGEAYVVFGTAGGPGDIDVGTMSTTQGLTISGVAAGDQAGIVATSAGDFNGDGIDDILVDARRADPLGRTYAGEAYVIYGKLGGPGDIDLGALTAAQGFKIAGETDTNYAGEAASSVGDINGDGLDDIILGAPFFASGIGRAYVIYGNASGSNDLDLAALTPAEGFTISGFDDDDFLGRSVDSAGDINGDGIGDLVVSAYRGGYAASGVVYVVYGKQGGLGDVDLTTLASDDGFRLTGFQDGGEIGRSVSSAGDVNGDGIDDIIVGAPDLDVVDKEFAGQAFLIYGKEGGHGDIDVTTLDVDQGFAISGAAANDHAGFDVSAAGDVNGDGFADLLVGAYGAAPNGASYVIYGGDTTGSVTHLGTTGDDVLTGTGSDEIFVGGLGNDVLDGGGGADAFQGGAGDDAIHASDGTFKKVDGGNGIDALHLDFDGAIDLGNIDGDAATLDHTKIRNIETIDADNGFSNQITLRLSDVLDIDADDKDIGGVAALDNVLKVDGNTGDALSLDPADGWSAADTTTLPDYAIYAVNNVKIAVDQDINVAVA